MLSLTGCNKMDDYNNTDATTAISTIMLMLYLPGSAARFVTSTITIDNITIANGIYLVKIST
jgi:hypothetical protein